MSSQILYGMGRSDYKQYPSPERWTYETIIISSKIEIKSLCRFYISFVRNNNTNAQFRAVSYTMSRLIKHLIPSAA